MYTDEINTLILISLLKEHQIKKIIASPGTTNISFIRSVQSDSYFTIYSAVDERSAAYMACGLAEECGEPVVLSCTGATASRNYLPGLTEAYYRHIPVLAITSTQHIGCVGNYVAQVIDRSERFPDLVKKSVFLRTVHDAEDEQHTVTAVNEALLELSHLQPGPVHINLETLYSNRFTVETLPKYRVIRRIMADDLPFPAIPNGKTAIFIGAHKPFSKEETEAIDSFCETNNAVVIGDQVSNYRGKFRLLAAKLFSQQAESTYNQFDLTVYIGYVHGTYMRFRERELWRVNPDGIIRDPYRNLTKVFEMEELAFFRHYIGKKSNNVIFESMKEKNRLLAGHLPEIPFSNMWIAKETAGCLQNNSVLHLSILNTLRVWNYFETPPTVEVYSNTGGYGIDGCLSSFLGAAAVNVDTIYYLVIGDLSFFYDINAVYGGIPQNAHIMLINNGVGTEFKNYNHRAAVFGNDADAYIAAKGHNGNRSPEVVKHICKELGVTYYAARNKDEFLMHKDEWLNSKNAVILEAFTEDYEESKALELMNTINL